MLFPCLPCPSPGQQVLRDPRALSKYEPVMVARVVYYLDVISSWCHWAEPAWEELQRRYSGVVAFEWRIALMDSSGLPVSHAQEEWFYRRSGVTVGAPYMLNGAWLEPGQSEYLAPNAVAEAARTLGVTGDRVRLAMAHAALREGRKVGQWKVAVEAGAAAAQLDPQELEILARSADIEQRLRASTQQFHALGVDQRPTFAFEDEIGDRAVLSGITRLEPMVAILDAMLADSRAYRSWKAHFGDPPRT